MAADTPRGTVVRRSVLFGAPTLAYAAGVLHPRGPVVGDDPSRFLIVHLAQPVLVALLAFALLLLVESNPSRAAAAVRLLVIPFAVAYTAFDAYAGIAMGELVGRANDLPAADQAAASLLIHDARHAPLGLALHLISSGLWIATAGAAAVALWPRAHAAAVLVAAGAAVFAVSHARPWGPLGMAVFLAGVVWSELPPKHARLVIQRAATKETGS